MEHCAECCFGSGVEADIDCPIHGEDQTWTDVLVGVVESVTEERYEQVKRYGLNDECADGTGPGVAWIPVRCGGESALFIEARMREDYEEFKSDTDGPPTWLHLIREEVAEAFKEEAWLDNENLDTELLQVAALCQAWVESRRRRRAAQSV